MSRIRRKLQKALHDFTGSNVARRANISPTATMAIKPSGIVQLAASTIYSKPTSTIPMMITGLPVRVVGTGSDYAGNTFGQMILEYLPLLFLIFIHLFLTMVIIWSGFVYRSILKGFESCHSRICGYFLRSYLELQMAMATNSYAPIAQGNKLGCQLAWVYRPHKHITKMICYVPDLFDQLYSCILVYEKLLSERDEAIKSLNDQIAKLEQSNTAKDEDLKEYKRSQTATNDVNTRLETEVDKNSKGIATLEDQLEKAQTSSQDSVERNAILQTEAREKDEIILTRNKEITSLRSQLKNHGESHVEEVKAVKVQCAHELSLKDAELDSTKIGHDAALREVRDECVRRSATKESERVTTRAAHDKEVAELKNDSARKLATKDVETNTMKSSHTQKLKDLTSQLCLKDRLIEDAQTKHVQDLDDALKQSACALGKKDLQITNLQVSHAKEITVLETQSTQDLADKDAKIANMKVAHDQEIGDLAIKSTQDLADKDTELAKTKIVHDQEMKGLATKSTQDLANKDVELANMKVVHDQEMMDLATKSNQYLAEKDAEIANIKLAHDQEKRDFETNSIQNVTDKAAEVADFRFAHEQEIKELKVAHVEEIRGLETKSAQDLAKKDVEVADIKLAHEQETRDLTNVWASRLASKEAEIENINAKHDPKSSITEDDAALAPATDDFDPNDSDTSHPNNIKDHTADDPDESSEVLPSGKPNGKVSQKKKRRRRKRAVKPEDGQDKPDAADGDIEQGSDHEPDTDQTVRAGKQPANSATRPPIDRSENSAAGSAASTTARNESERIPDNAPVGPSQFRAGPHIFNALPPPANAPTGPRGHAPRDAPRGPRSEFNQRGGYRRDGESDRGFGGFGRGRGRGSPYQGGRAGW